MSYITELLEVLQLGEKYVPKVIDWAKSRNERTSWESYSKLFDVDGYKIPYINLINHWSKDIKGYNPTNINVRTLDRKFKLPDGIGHKKIPDGAFDGESCRLVHFNIASDAKLAFTFQETSYYDYLRSGEYLDLPYPGNDQITFRDAFGNHVKSHQNETLPFESLTNICGTGVFIVTSDNYILVSKHSEKSHVYPGRYSFTSSGIMKWGRAPTPLDEVADKCFDETNHKIDMEKVRLIGFGADARKLYFQFSFLEETTLTYQEILNENQHSDRDNHSSNLAGVRFNLETLIDKLVSNCWEPAAEAALLSICALKTSKKEVMREMFASKSQWEKKRMRDEWDYRASKSGLLPIMSVRYSQDKLLELSNDYVNKVINFIGLNIENKDIVEIGAGIGRLTGALAGQASKITCIEFCEKMLQKSLLTSEQKNSVIYFTIFAQEYRPQTVHDVAICSLVLMHNTVDIGYENLVENLCRMANTVYVFEDVTERRITSRSTKIRNREEICNEFNRYNFTLTRMELQTLDEDNLVFLEFKKSP